MPTPSQLAKPDTEHSHQVAFFAYIAVARQFGFNVADDWASGMGIEVAKSSRMNDCRPVPELEWVHANPNGGARGDDEKSAMIRGGKLKAEGVRAGIADIFCPIPKRIPRSVPRMGVCKDQELYWYCGLYIEMKKPALKPVSDQARGGVSDEQLAFKKYALSAGYGWAVCYSWREAVDVLRNYLDYQL